MYWFVHNPQFQNKIISAKNLPFLNFISYLCGLFVARRPRLFDDTQQSLAMRI